MSQEKWIWEPNWIDSDSGCPSSQTEGSPSVSPAWQGQRCTLFCLPVTTPKKLHPLLPSMNCRQHPIQFVESVNGFLFVKSVNSISVACNSLLWGSHLRRARYRNPDLPLCDMSHYCHIVAVTLCSLSMQTFLQCVWYQERKGKRKYKKTDGENLCICKTV